MLDMFEKNGGILCTNGEKWKQADEFVYLERIHDGEKKEGNILTTEITDGNLVESLESGGRNDYL